MKRHLVRGGVGRTNGSGALNISFVLIKTTHSLLHRCASLTTTRNCYTPKERVFMFHRSNLFQRFAAVLVEMRWKLSWTTV